MTTRRNIQQRGSSFLVDVSKHGKRQRITCATLEQATNLRATLELAGKGTQVDDQWTLGEAVEKCIEKVWSGKLSEDTAVYRANMVLDFFKSETMLDAITTDMIDGWIARLKQSGNSNATVNRKLAALSKIMTFAHRRGKMTTRPHLERQRESQGRIRFLTQEEEARALAFLAQWGKDCHAEALCVLVDTGMRPSELWRLEHRDLDFTSGLLSIWQTKNGEARSVPMTQRVQEILKRRSEGTRGPLFPFSNRWMQNGWDKAKTAMDLTRDDQFVPYALRHTCASRLVQRGVHLAVVQKWMGHKTIGITMRYAHLSPANLMEAVKVLEAC